MVALPKDDVVGRRSDSPGTAVLLPPDLRSDGRATVAGETSGADRWTCGSVWLTGRSRVGIGAR